MDAHGGDVGRRHDGAGGLHVHRRRRVRVALQVRLFLSSSRGRVTAHMDASAARVLAAHCQWLSCALCATACLSHDVALMHSALYIQNVLRRPSCKREAQWFWSERCASDVVHLYFELQEPQGRASCTNFAAHHVAKRAQKHLNCCHDLLQDCSSDLRLSQRSSACWQGRGHAGCL